MCVCDTGYVCIDTEGVCDERHRGYTGVTHRYRGCPPQMVQESKREKKTAALMPFSHGKKRMTINDDALGNKLN